MEKQVIRVMFTGDSITDCQRARPVGDGVGTLGNSYVGNLFCMTWAEKPECRARFMNSATSGDTSRQLLARFDDEVLAYNPNYLFIMIGVNDAWRIAELPVNTEVHISSEETAANMEKMILKAREKGAEPIILSPFFMDLDKNEFMRYHVDEINALYKKLAEKYSVGYIDVQSAIDKWISKASSYILSSDRVHPKAIGVSLIARTIFEHPVFRGVVDR